MLEFESLTDYMQCWNSKNHLSNPYDRENDDEIKWMELDLGEYRVQAGSKKLTKAHSIPSISCSRPWADIWKL